MVKNVYEQRKYAEIDQEIDEQQLEINPADYPIIDLKDEDRKEAARRNSDRVRRIMALHVIEAAARKQTKEISVEQQAGREYVVPVRHSR